MEQFSIAQKHSNQCVYQPVIRQRKFGSKCFLFINPYHSLLGKKARRERKRRREERELPQNDINNTWCALGSQPPRQVSPLLVCICESYSGLCVLTGCCSSFRGSVFKQMTVCSLLLPTTSAPQFLSGIEQ